MHSIEPGARGRYTVRTVTSTYLLDLDRAVLVRDPAPQSPPSWPAPAALRRDHTEIALLAVLECHVGRPMAVLVGLGADAAAPMTLRVTTAVQAITPDE